MKHYSQKDVRANLHEIQLVSYCGLVFFFVWRVVEEEEEFFVQANRKGNQKLVLLSSSK
jgi:hypothetical protein